MLAAATTSLPETPGGERNYDYRYSWLRDSTFLLWGLYTLGLDREAIDYFYFLTDLAEEDPDLQIMYGIGGERELTEQILDHLQLDALNKDLVLGTRRCSARSTRPAATTTRPPTRSPRPTRAGSRDTSPGGSRFKTGRPRSRSDPRTSRSWST
jgi:Glycosyl hydrolases family 15